MEASTFQLMSSPAEDLRKSMTQPRVECAAGPKEAQRTRVSSLESPLAASCSALGEGMRNAAPGARKIIISPAGPGGEWLKAPGGCASVHWA